MATSVPGDSRRPVGERIDLSTVHVGHEIKVRNCHLEETVWLTVDATEDGDPHVTLPDGQDFWPRPSEIVAHRTPDRR